MGAKSGTAKCENDLPIPPPATVQGAAQHRGASGRRRERGGTDVAEFGAGAGEINQQWGVPRDKKPTGVRFQ